MKCDEIKKLLPDIKDEVLDQIMNLHSADVGTHKNSVTALTTEENE